MKKPFFLIVAGSLILPLFGCSQLTKPDLRPVADDPVCAFNRDLGCVRVRIDTSTPRASYRGKTYYFCSEECRAAFEKDPEKYLPQEGKN